MTDKPTWVQKSAFVMPTLPESLGIDPCVAALVHCVAFLELSEDDVVNPDAAIEAMEQVGSYLGRSSAKELEQLGQALHLAATHVREQGDMDEFAGFLDDFLDSFGLDVLKR